MKKIVALVLTYNEENIIGKCLSALDFVDEIVVFDSFSTDETENIALAHSAKVVKREFDNYANQRNEAIKYVSENFDWILMLDADEIISPALVNEIKNICNNSDTKETMFRVRRKDMFQNKWIKQSSGYPTWFPRLFKSGNVTVSRAINEEYNSLGPEGYLQEHLIHYPFNKGLTWWFSKHNRYSLMEAQVMINEKKIPITIKNLFLKNPIKRRKEQKRLSYRIPFRPMLIFISFYILKGGFMNGRAGYQFCRLRMIYETMIAYKIAEIKEKN